MVLNIDLEECEWDMVDAEAYACGLTRQQLLHEMLVEGAELELRDMDRLSTTGDSQWKSH